MVRELEDGESAVGGPVPLNVVVLYYRMGRMPGTTRVYPWSEEGGRDDFAEEGWKTGEFKKLEDVIELKGGLEGMYPEDDEPNMLDDVPPGFRK